MKKWSLTVVSIGMILTAFFTNTSNNKHQKANKRTTSSVPTISQARARKLTKEFHQIMKSGKVLSPIQVIRAQAVINTLRQNPHYAKTADKLQRSLNKSKVRVEGS